MIQPFEYVSLINNKNMHLFYSWPLNNADLLYSQKYAYNFFI